VPGVESVSWAANAPLGAKQYRRVSLHGQAQQDGTTSVLTLVNTVDVGYFRRLPVDGEIGVGLLALGLASVGIYGVMAYSVTQRTREMGLRIALGANPSAVRRLGLTQAMRLVGFGLLLGLGGALLLGRSMASLLYGA
jgi:hypothetical protein